MMPGCVAGLYNEPQLYLELDALCQFTGWTFVQARVTRIDAETKKIECLKTDAAGANTDTAIVVNYDILSVDAGSITAGTDMPGVKEYALSTRPLSVLMPKIVAYEKKRVAAGDTAPLRVIVVGAGVAGIELAMAIDARFRGVNDELGNVDLPLPVRSETIVTIVNSQAKLLDGDAVSKLIVEHLASRGISLLNSARATNLKEKTITISQADGSTSTLDYDLLVYSTGAAPPALFSNSNLALSPEGFLLVDNALRSLSHPDSVFGAGDCICMSEQPKNFPPKAGVYAVRQGPILLENVKHAITVAKERLGLSSSSAVEKVAMKDYHPQTGFLALLSLGDGVGIGSKFGVAFQGRWVWNMKTWIDETWMALFDIRTMQAKKDKGESMLLKFELSSKPVENLNVEMAAEALLRGLPEKFLKAGKLSKEVKEKQEREKEEFYVQWAAVVKMSNEADFAKKVVARMTELTVDLIVV